MTENFAGNSYDQIPYPTGAIIHSHPDRLAMLGRLFGMSPAPITSCRVLEIACGNGNNLIPMARQLPQSEFTGVDAAGIPIAQGQQAIADMGLTNIRLRHCDLREVGSDWGHFDFIIAHGIYSWVAPEVRESILGLCRDRLTPQGIALISYNAQPGGHVRSIVRDMMRFHTKHMTDPAERTEQARALVRFAAEARQGSDEFQQLMQSELERIRHLEPNYLIHDDLSEWNTAFYVTDFAAAASRHGLQFLAEADPFEMQDAQLPSETRLELAKLGGNRLLREQYLDFIKCRRFRLTLLCRAEVLLLPEPSAEAVTGFHIASRSLRTSPEDRLAAGINMQFESPRGPKLDCPFPVGKAALLELIEAWPVRLPFAQLAERVREKLAGGGIEAPVKQDLERVIAQFLLQIHGVGLADFHLFAPAVTKEWGTHPRVDALARWQAARGAVITTRRHDLIRLNDALIARLVVMMDGTRLLPELVSELEVFLRDRPDASGLPAYHSRQTLEEDLLRNLATFARAGLFVPPGAKA